MSESKTPLTRDNTMQVTAKEGVHFLQAAGKETLLEMQGLNKATDGDGDKSTLQRAGTMATTAKEGEKFLDSFGSTIDDDAHTRGQQKKLEEIAEESEPVTKKAKMAKVGTMVETTRIGKALLGNEKLGETRQESQAMRDRRGNVKRLGTMQKTMKEAQDILKEGLDSPPDFRQTRSRTRGDDVIKTPVKRVTTMQQTAKEGKEYLKRGRKSKKAVASEEKSDDGKDDEADGNGEEQTDSAAGAAAVQDSTEEEKTE